MKKILISSTALIALTGAAAADVALSGRAEMGFFKTSFADAQFFTDIDVSFTMTGETDGGLEFGASVDLDEGGSGAAAVANNADDGGATIFVRGSFGTVTMGDTDGALDWALTEAGNVGNPGSIADDETAHAGYVGSYLDGALDGQILRYDNTFGGFGIAVSIDDDNGSAALDAGFAIGLRYSLDLGGTTVNLGAGYQEANGADVMGISANASLGNGFSIGAVYADWDDGDGLANGGADSNMGIGIGYSSGQLSVHANYGVVDFDNNTDVSGFGVSAAYDLGGGAVVHFGYGRSDNNGAFDPQSASLGLGLSF